ncbi:MAG: hypothetical protein KDB79_16870, partial [Acidobacteria bacterium]|nr:hypothetical protein [Acidobacteriota bacterium]
MEQIYDQIHQLAVFIAPLPWLRALIIIAISLIFGKIADWVVTGILSNLVSKTKNDFDDRVLTLLHRPIFLSVLLIGLGIATYEFELNQQVTSVTVNALKTIGLLVWF